MENFIMCENNHGDSNNTESIMAALNKFVQAVEVMDETVMIPSRLKDMEITATNGPEILEENNNRALMPLVSKGTNLHNFYTLLKTVKTDLTLGCSSLNVESGNQDGEINEADDDSSKHLATAFSYHLRGLFSILRQMTETANYLSDRYESEVGGDSKKPPLSSFAI